jgi:hypothetical protein
MGAYSRRILYTALVGADRTPHTPNWATPITVLAFASFGFFLFLFGFLPGFLFLTRFSSFILLKTIYILGKFSNFEKKSDSKKLNFEYCSDSKIV